MPFAVGTAGFAGIALEIVMLLSFQVLYGYVYHIIGIIIASFMMGLIAGTVFMNRIIGGIKRDILAFSALALSVALYSLILPLLIGASSFESAWIILPALTAFAGFFVGAEFPLASKICMKEITNVGRTAGMLYGADLLGACGGALVTSSLLVPLFGITNVCVFAAMLNFISFILLIGNYA